MQIFYKQLGLVTFLSGAGLLGSDLLGLTHIGLPGWMALVFFAGLTTVLTKISLKSSQKGGSRFVTSVMGNTGLRMLLCVVFVVIYWVNANPRDLQFVAYFFILYLFFTVFEIKFLLHKLRSDKKEGLESKSH